MSSLRAGRIHTPDWTADFQSDGRVVTADLEIKFMKGWPDDRVRSYCKEHGWRVTRLITAIEKAESLPLVQAVMKHFPGAVVVSVRSAQN
jgi:hypothetical protein